MVRRSWTMTWELKQKSKNCCCNITRSAYLSSNDFFFFSFWLVCIHHIVHNKKQLRLQTAAGLLSKANVYCTRSFYPDRPTDCFVVCLCKRFLLISSTAILRRCKYYITLWDGMRTTLTSIPFEIIDQS